VTRCDQFEQIKPQVIEKISVLVSGAIMRTLLPFWLLSSAFVLACDYSRIHPEHTACIFKPMGCPGPGKRIISMHYLANNAFAYLCLFTFFPGSGGLSCEEKRQILDVHNGLRSVLAEGKVKGQPAAKNMRELVW